MWNNSFRLALIQLIYQNRFQQVQGLDIGILSLFELEDINLNEVDEDKLQECYAIFVKNSELMEKHLEFLFTDIKKTFLLSKVIVMVYLIESYTKVLNDGEHDEDRKNLIKIYLRIADKIISDGTVGTLHAALTKSLEPLNLE